jgi:formylglycine-generating enzyme required for sulfatase activity
MRTNRNLCLVAIVAVLIAGMAVTVDAKVKKGNARKTNATTGKVSSKKTKKSSSNNLTFTVKGVKFEMVPVDGGSYKTQKCDEYDPTEEKIVILKSYYIGQTEVTQALWTAVMGDNPSIYKNDKYPVMTVSFNDCQNFLIKLNELTGKNFRLPSVVEWQFAASGGNKSKGYIYAGSNDLDKVAWYENSSNGEPHMIATKAANELGIYDMSGNVFEWCNDYDNGTRSSSPDIGPGLAAPTAYFCGGSWLFPSKHNEIKYKESARAFDINDNVGLRLALDK